MQRGSRRAPGLADRLGFSFTLTDVELMVSVRGLGGARATHLKVHGWSGFKSTDKMMEMMISLLMDF